MIVTVQDTQYMRGRVVSMCDGSCLESALLFLATRRPIDRERRVPDLDSKHW